MKLTKKQINQINQLKEEEKTAKEIAIELKLPISTVQYHYSEANKKRAINYQKKYQKDYPPKRGDDYKKYQKKYQKDRYNDDEEFRERIKKQRKERYLRLKKEKKGKE